MQRWSLNGENGCFFKPWSLIHFVARQHRVLKIADLQDDVSQIRHVVSFVLQVCSFQNETPLCTENVPKSNSTPRHPLSHWFRMGQRRFAWGKVTSQKFNLRLLDKEETFWRQYRHGCVLSTMTVLDWMDTTGYGNPVETQNTSSSQKNKTKKSNTEER